MSNLQTERGKVIRMGRVKIHKSPGFNYEIPLLAFIVIEQEDGNHIATCIHLLIDGYGPTPSEASKDMVGNVKHYLHDNFNCAERKEDAWDGLYELLKSTPRSGFWWDKYHALQIELAKRDIPTDTYSELHQKILFLEKKLRAEAGSRKELEVELDKVHRLEAELEKVRHLETELTEKVRHLETELSERDEFITYWLADRLIWETEDQAVVEPVEGEA